jgi:hypothetical protein
LLGPYFSGQQLYSCGHFYPDVLRLRDEQRSDGSCVRIVDCTVCGKLEYPLGPAILSPDLVHTLDRDGFLAGIKEEELAEVRRAAMRTPLAEFCVSMGLEPSPLVCPQLSVVFVCCTFRTLAQFSMKKSIISLFDRSACSTPIRCPESSTSI